MQLAQMPILPFSSETCHVLADCFKTPQSCANYEWIRANETVVFKIKLPVTLQNCDGHRLNRFSNTRNYVYFAAVFFIYLVVFLLSKRCTTFHRMCSWTSVLYVNVPASGDFMVWYMLLTVLHGTSFIRNGNCCEQRFFPLLGIAKLARHWLVTTV